MDASICPEPCTGHIVTYYWSKNEGSAHFFDKASTNADPYPCWLPVFDEVEDGPPPDGVTTWDVMCIDGLVQKLEESENDGRGQVTPPASVEQDGAAENAGAPMYEGDVILSAFIIPSVIFFCIGSAFVILRHQSMEKRRKMQVTDEAWGVAKGGQGLYRSNETLHEGTMPSPTLSAATHRAVGAIVDDGSVYAGYPPRLFTEISIGDGQPA